MTERATETTDIGATTTTTTTTRARALVGRPLDDETVAYLRDLLRTRGCVAAARDLRIHRHVLTAAAAGAPLREGTHLMIARALAERR